MRLTPEEVYDKLQNDFKISEQKGLIHFDLGNVGITVTQKDVVGNIMQEWLAQWFRDNDVDFAGHQQKPVFSVASLNRRLATLDRGRI